MHQFTQQIIDIAHNCIPESSSKTHKRQVPRWNSQICELIKERKRMLRIFRLHPSNQYIDSIDQSTTSTDFDVKINRIRGNYKSTTVPVINCNQTYIISNLLAKELQDASSSQNYSPDFKSNVNEIKDMLNTIPKVTVPSNLYNSNFTIKELEGILRKCKGSSPGPDGVHYDMIKHQSRESKQSLLHIFNDI